MTVSPFMTPAWPAQIIADGQSLMNSPLSIFDDSGMVADQCWRRIKLRTGITTHAVAVNAASITTLATTVSTRVHPLGTARAGANVWAFIGAETDLFMEGDTGAAAYAELVAYWSGIETAWAGLNPLSVVCTCPPSSSFVGGEETARDDFNVLVKANSAGFDAVVDLELDAELADYTSDAYYSDELHWNTRGADLAATMIATAIDSLIP